MNLQKIQMKFHELVKVGGQGSTMWLEKGAEKDIAGMVSDSNAFWGKVTDEDKMEVKDRPARRIRSSVAFWENCGYKWECGQLKVGERKNWKSKVKRWEG